MSEDSSVKSLDWSLARLSDGGCQFLERSQLANTESIKQTHSPQSSSQVIRTLVIMLKCHPCFQLFHGLSLFSCEGAAQHVHLCLCLSVRLTVSKLNFLCPLCPFVSLYAPLYSFIPHYKLLHAITCFIS